MMLANGMPYAVKGYSSKPDKEIDTQVSADQFKGTMRKLASSVTVITAAKDLELNGVTATAFCSVCAEPPTVLAVINRKSRTHLRIEQAEAFAVNILSEDQKGLADNFSVREEGQFDNVEYTHGVHTGAPVLAAVAAHLECALLDRVDMGSHTVFFGRVLNCESVARKPLPYFEGHYMRLG